MQNYVVSKVLNNNVLIAENDLYKEVVLIGKGIGFNKKKGEQLSQEVAEKIFVLKDKNEQEQYKKLLPQMDEIMSSAIIEAFELIRKRTQSILNDHTFVALTDHIIFSIQRYLKGVTISNPFLMETKALYPKEYEIASEVVDMVNDIVQIQLPEDEMGFIALHIHSVLNNRKLSDVNHYSRLVGQLIQVVEKELNIQVDKESIDYMRLVRHLRFTIERVNNQEEIVASPKISSLLQKEYPICYNLAWKLIKIMQNALKKPIGDGEVVYLTMHIQRIPNKTL